MFKNALKNIKIASRLLLVFTLLTGLIYPAVVTGIAQTLFPRQANGSLITQEGNIVGSMLIGQEFTDNKYFWGRPSTTMDYPYNALYSSGSNMGPSNPQFLLTVKTRMHHLQQSSVKHNEAVPIDLVTASASGLDPEISPLAALYQVPRIAKARKISKEKILDLISQLTQYRKWRILGEPRINVLELNLGLEKLENA